MKVVTVRTEEGKERYYVADDNGIPIESILKFVKFKDNLNYARNSLKQYCQSLKLYFEYLEFIEKDFKDITIDDLSLFVNWLQRPSMNKKIIKIELRSRPMIFLKKLKSFYLCLIGILKDFCMG